MTADVHYHFIDDGSTDSTLSILRDLSKINDNVHYISFSRNFGKEAGLYAGLQQADGDYVAVMDVDLQDPPELLPEMLREFKTVNMMLLEPVEPIVMARQKFGHGFPSNFILG